MCSGPGGEWHVLPVVDTRASGACVSSSGQLLCAINGTCVTGARHLSASNLSGILLVATHRRTAVTPQNKNKKPTASAAPPSLIVSMPFSWSVERGLHRIDNIYFCSSTRNAYNIFSVVTSTIHKSDHGGTSDQSTQQRILQLRVNKNGGSITQVKISWKIVGLESWMNSVPVNCISVYTNETVVQK